MLIKSNIILILVIIFGIDLSTSNEDSRANLPSLPPGTIYNIAFTPIVKTTITYESVFVCNSSYNSALNIRSVEASGSYLAQVTCNGLVVNSDSISFIASPYNTNNKPYSSQDEYGQYDSDGQLTKIKGHNSPYNSQGSYGQYGSQSQLTKINVNQYEGVSTYTDGDRSLHESGVVRGGPCDSSVFWGMSIWIADQQFGCNTTSGVVSDTAIYRIWTLTGSCNTTCQVYLLGGLGRSTYTLRPPVSIYGLVNG